VENQKDLQILLDWKRTLQNKINELKVRLEVAYNSSESFSFATALKLRRFWI